MPEEIFLIHRLFNDTASRFSDKTALQSKELDRWRRWTYKEIKDHSLRIGAFLTGQGLKKGDFAAVILESRPEWGIIYLGIMNAGLICVPIDPESSPQEIKNLIRDSAPGIIFCSYGLFAKKIKQVKKEISVATVVLDVKKSKEEGVIDFCDIKDVSWSGIDRPQVFPEDTASLIYTSGTTGKPKGVLLSHKNICSNFMSIKKANICFSSDNFLSVLPLYHSYAFMVTLMTPLFLGATITYCASFKSEDIAGIIKEAKVTILAVVPQFFSMMHKAVFDKFKKVPFFLRPLFLPAARIRIQRYFGRTLRLLVSGGARLDPKIAGDLSRLGFKLIEGYGLTETAPVVTLNPAAKVKFGSAGRPVPDVEVGICRSGKSATGEVLIKGPNVMQGYFRQPELTAQVIKDGWFYSGDIGYLDKNGYLFLAGRKKEVIVLSSGKNINPEELEEYYLKSPYVKEICVTLKQEESFGYLKDSLFAVVVPDLEFFAQKKETGIHEKIRWELETLGRQLPSYKHIMGFTLSKEGLPRTSLKKIKRYAVKEKYLTEASKNEPAGEAIFSQADTGVQDKDVSTRVIEYIAKEIKKPVSLDSHLEIDLGVDSLTRVELGIGLEALLKIKIPERTLHGVSTVKDLISNIEVLLKGADAGIGAPEKTAKSWSRILKEPLPEEITGKIRIDFGFLERLFSRLLKAAFSPVFKLCWFLRVEGKENLPKKGPYLICPNHASYLDGLFIFFSLPFENAVNTYFLGLQRIFEYPLFGWINRIGRFISIDAALNLTEAMQAVSFALSRDKIVCIFPEGTRSIDENIREFKKGVGILLKELDIPVIPVNIKGSHHSWPMHNLLPRFYPVKVIFGRPFCFEELKKQGLNLGAKDDYQAAALGLRQEVEKLA